MEFLVNGERKIYFDVQEELYKFTGKIIASMFVGGTIDIGEGTFTVDDEGKVTINSGSIIITREDGKARIVISEATGISFQKWNEALEDWEETIGLDSEGAGVITGGTLRTAKDGRRIEISDNQIRCYNDNGELHGLVTNNSSRNYGDWEFYDEGTPVFKVYNTLETGVALMPMSGATLQVGVEGNGLALHGNVRHKGKLGFFGGSAVSKTNVSTLDSGATQQEIQDKLNELIQALNNYNLV
jgi:hypothetical protein